MDKYNNLVQGIITQYQKILPELTESKQQHFRSRLYKISGDTTLLQSLQNDTFQVFAKKIQAALDGKRELDLDIRYKRNTPIARQKIRNQFIHKHIQFCKPFLEYLDVLMEYNVLHRYKKAKDLDPNLIAKINTLLDSQFEDYFNSLMATPDFLLYMPVQVINLLYWYQHLPNTASLDIQKQEDILFSKIKEYYTEAIINSNLIFFLNYLYTLTHIIIGKSWFYEYKVNPAGLEWIYAEFTKYQPQIFGTKENDIIAEIGVCWALATQPKADIVAQYQGYIASQIDPNYNYIPSGQYPIGSFEDLNLSEHRNILAILLLSNLDYLYEFPS